jgi:predicted nucleotidyltransferase
MGSENLTEILAALRMHLSLILGESLEKVYLYGSQARGDATPGSDIDVLIVINGNFDYFNLMDKTSEISWRLSLENDVVISRVFVAKDKFDQSASPFLMNVRQEAIPV